MQDPISADWYFDFISPFAYLQLEQFEGLPPRLQVSLKPVLLGALLSHWENKGPAEIPEKRRHTYRYAQFRAEQLGIPFRMPPAHPFNPVRLLRLAIVAGGGQDAVRAIFRFIWREGRDPGRDDDWRDLCERLGVDAADEAVAQDGVKADLRRNTEQAISRGVFGVPTFALGGELFWGEDATGMLLHCLQSPQWLHSDELRRISTLPVGVQRKA